MRPFNGHIKVLLELDGMTVIKKEVLDIDQELKHEDDDE